MTALTSSECPRFSLSLKVAGLLLVALLFSPRAVSADIGSKPEMTFEFVYETAEPLTIVAGEQWQCDTPRCANPRLLEEGGPQGFRCSATDCTSTAYGYSDYNRLVIAFSDGVTRESNVFETRSFNNNYRVTVRPDDMQVGWTGGSNPRTRLLAGVLLVCACLLLLVAGLAAGVVTLIRRRRAAAG